MLALLGLSTLGSLIASGTLGVRLVLLARRTRELPELLMGAAFLIAGVIGYILMLVGTAGAQSMPEQVARAWFLAGYGGISVGVILTYGFVWRVFYPSSKLCMGVVGVAAVGVALTSLPFALPGLSSDMSVAPTGVDAMIFWLGHALRIGVGIWGTWEAGRYWLVLRRRMRLFLVDPVVTNRIGMWALASFGGAVIFLSTAIANSGGGSMEEVMGPGQILLISSVTLSVAICQWFAFLPPKRYLEWIAGRTAQG